MIIRMVLISTLLSISVHLTENMHFNAQRVKTVGCLPRLAASAAVKVLCRSECVWGSVRLSAVPGQTTDGPPWAVSLCPLTRILSQTAVQSTNFDNDVYCA